MRPGPTRYVSVAGSQVAYQVTDTGGPIDFVYMMGQGSIFEHWWDHPIGAKALERFASFGRLIMFDRRGCGYSDRFDAGHLPTWENYAQDLEAVLDAAGSERPAILAQRDGGATAMTFAASHPERVRALVLWEAYARWWEAEDYPVGMPSTEIDMLEAIAPLWGTEDFARMLAPDEADDPSVMRWVARNLRASQTPRAFAEDCRRQLTMDARPALPLIKAPTLVMYRRDGLWLTPELCEYVTEHIPDARSASFGGHATGIWGVDIDEILDTIEQFVLGSRANARSDRVLATVLFTDIVGSTERASQLGDTKWKELLSVHDATSRRVLDDWRGCLVKTTGDGLLARFDGPGRAIRCALDLIVELRRHGIEIRAGLHAGEIELRDDGDIGGIAVHIAARVQTKAGNGQVLCSRTVKDLTAGSGLTFDDWGTHELKGVPDTWQLFAVA